MLQQIYLYVNKFGTKMIKIKIQKGKFAFWFSVNSKTIEQARKVSSLPAKIEIGRLLQSFFLHFPQFSLHFGGKTAKNNLVK